MQELNNLFHNGMHKALKAIIDMAVLIIDRTTFKRNAKKAPVIYLILI